MDYKKSIQTSIILIISIILLVSSVLSQEWTTVTSQKFIHELKVIDDTLFSASTGGLAAITDSDVQSRMYFNTDGLNTNDISSIITDLDGNRWITSKGYLTKISNEKYYPYVMFDNDNNLLSLTVVADDNDYLWLGSSAGLILFSKLHDGGQIEDSYGDFGSLNPDPSIYSIMVDNNDIWIGTSSGMAITDRTDFIQMKSPSAWNTLSMDNFPEMLSDTVIDVVKFNTNYYFATTKQVFQYSVDSVLNDTSIFDITPLSATRIYDLSVVNDTLFILFDVSSSPRISYLVNTLITNLPATGLTSPPISIASYNNKYWIAVKNGGLFYHDGSTFVSYPFIGLPGNDITDITVSGAGQTYAASRTYAFARETDSVWEDLNIYVSGGTTKLLTDPKGRPWLGTRGNGVWLVTDTGLINYDETNSTLIGNTDNPPFGLSYVYISGMESDGRYLYFACYRAANGNPLVYADLENLDDISGWGEVGIAEGLSNTFTTSLDQANGRVAIGTESDGVFECAVGDNPFQSANTCRHLIRENSLLISNNIRVVKYDPNGDLWVGTNVGLSRYDPGIDFFVDVTLPANINTDITALNFDSRGNAWIGTKEGLLFLDIITGEYMYYSTLNSGLVADNIQNIHFDKSSGKIFIATDAGFSIHKPIYGIPTDTLENVLAFPNPFVINGSDNLLHFNYAFQANLIIFSIAGEQIIEMPLQPWNGKNERGDNVASGVYLFVLINDIGEVARGKFLLIRQ